MVRRLTQRSSQPTCGAIGERPIHQRPSAHASSGSPDSSSRRGSTRRARIASPATPLGEMVTSPRALIGVGREDGLADPLPVAREPNASHRPAPVPVGRDCQLQHDRRNTTDIEGAGWTSELAATGDARHGVDLGARVGLSTVRRPAGRRTSRTRWACQRCSTPPAAAPTAQGAEVHSVCQRARL